MNEDNNGTPTGGADPPPDYNEMATRLHEIGTQLISEGQAKDSDDLIDKGQRLLRIAARIRTDQTS